MNDAGNVIPFSRQPDGPEEDHGDETASYVLGKLYRNPAEFSSEEFLMVSMSPGMTCQVVTLDWKRPGKEPNTLERIGDAWLPIGLHELRGLIEVLTAAEVKAKEILQAQGGPQ